MGRLHANSGTRARLGRVICPLAAWGLEEPSWSAIRPANTSRYHAVLWLQRMEMVEVL